uniref:Uncharacterized protein n=1 Tax=Rhizophora mucronata TaxID=61149 RepID=A0A2P2PMX8_RHIMU
MQVEHQNVDEDKNFLTETRNGDIHGEVVILCNEVHCTGMNRKLATVTTAISTDTSKTEKNGESEANPMATRRLANGEMGGQHEKVSINSSPASGHQEVDHDLYVGITDIAEMDYSPVKRKTPIHN